MARQKGGKLTRSEVVPVRFDPKLKWACDLLGARERRTISSLIEWSMEKISKEIEITTDQEGKALTAWQVAELCWDETAMGRVLNLVMHCPQMLTRIERRSYTLALSLKNFEQYLSGKENNCVVWNGVTEMIWGYVVACAEGQIKQDELHKYYQEARMQLLMRFERSGTNELQELVKQGGLDNYPNAKNLIERILGIDEIPAA